MAVENENMNVKCIYNHYTKFNADSVEFCPFDPFKNYFVCANYQLKENSEATEGKRERFGKILLFKFVPEDGLNLIQEINTDAVLDQKWGPQVIGNDILLAVATAASEITIYKLRNYKLEKVTSYRFKHNFEELLILSLDWSNLKEESKEPSIICSDSQGSIHHLSLVDEGTKLKLNFSSKNHDFETWITGFYYWNPNVFFSGGDDSILSKYDRRISQEAITKNKQHLAGVTAVHSDKSREYILATGSYDENLRLWDLRSFKTPLSCTKMVGPVWRLKWDPFDDHLLLSGCMLGGVHILDGSNLEAPEIVGSFHDHKNLAYGIDWSYCKKNGYVFGSCSFYDNLLCVSSFQALK